jgi:hypothetical protein
MLPCHITSKNGAVGNLKPICFFVILCIGLQRCNLRVVVHYKLCDDVMHYNNDNNEFHVTRNLHNYCIKGNTSKIYFHTFFD